MVMSNSVELDTENCVYKYFFWSEWFISELAKQIPVSTVKDCIN